MNTIRAFLKFCLGPSADIDTYTDEQALARFHDIQGFYGSTIMKSWLDQFEDRHR